MLTNKLMGKSGEDKQFIEDLFAVHLYTGNGGTQTINNGIALADGFSLTPGTALAGGYFGGFISTSGNGVATHALIVAPKATGENSSKQWKTSNTSTLGTGSLIDGPANSATMNNASHPAAQFCEGLTIGGYSDWYMPARDELEVLYYFLKPTTKTNNTSSGSNANAVSPEPISTWYTDGSPAQTSAAAFKLGGAEAFAVAIYWSSTEVSTTTAWNQSFNDGYQDYYEFSGNKNYSLYVRAVRRVAIADAILDPYRVAGKGGLVWLKSRSSAAQHGLYDTTRGATKTLSSDQTAAQTTDVTSLTAFNANGFSIGAFAYYNNNAATYASWTFRKAPKFFDVVTYTGDGTSKRSINHGLGSTPGLIIYKATNDTQSWWVYQRTLPTDPNGIETQSLVLNSTSGVGGYGAYGLHSEQTSSVFTVRSPRGNVSGTTYVAYLFAHDTTADGLIQCGNYTGNGSTSGPIVSLGWEPQWVMIKNASGTGNWQIIDNMRGMPVGSADATLQANLNNAESSVDYVSPTATGFQVTSTNSEVNASGNTYLYMAIRRGPMRTPTSGSQVFAPIAVTPTNGGISTTNFPVDLNLLAYRPGTSSDKFRSVDRLRGIGASAAPPYEKLLITASADAEMDSSPVTYNWWNTGFTWSGSYAGLSMIAYAFRRAPGFFDVVCYTGTDDGGHFHSLGVIPELIIIKSRGTALAWPVKCVSALGRSDLALNLSSAAPVLGDTFWDNTPDTSTKFYTRAGNGYVNASSATYVAYLFASCPGVSKVGSYTGTGTTKQIDCGFTAGARFVLIKRTDSTGNWYTWDSARGIVSGNDPYLLMNSTAAEVTTTDYIDPYAAGFEISSTAPAEINASGGTFIYLAIA